MTNVWSQIVADNHRIVQHQTWGHLGPTDGVHYGRILCCLSAYGDLVLIDDDFPTLENSPWQYAALNTIVCDILEDRDTGVYSLEGWLKWGEVDDPGVLEVVEHDWEVIQLRGGYR